MQYDITRIAGYSNIELIDAYKTIRNDYKTGNFNSWKAQLLEAITKEIVTRGMVTPEADTAGSSSLSLDDLDR